MLGSILCLFVLLASSSGKKCCDQHCKSEWGRQQGVMDSYQLIMGHDNDCPISYRVDVAGPISYGRTTQRHIADPHEVGEAKFLSFPQGSLVQVFAKEVMGEEEYWEAEVGGACSALGGGVKVVMCHFLWLAGQWASWSGPSG